MLHQISRCFDIKLHYIRDEVKAKLIILNWILTDDRIADGLTKPLSAAKHLGFIELMRMSLTDSPNTAAPPKR